MGLGRGGGQGSRRRVNCGLIAVADTIRPDAREVVRQLHATGVAHVVMLTGDNRTTADAIARMWAPRYSW